MPGKAETPVDITSSLRSNINRCLGFSKTPAAKALDILGRMRIAMDM